MSQACPQRTLILGQGIAGSVLAWQLHWQSEAVILVNSSNIPCASTVAAGLMMPISGKKFTQHPDFVSRLHLAEAFYQRVEHSLGAGILKKISIFRRFLSDGERDFFLGERYESVKELVQLVAGPDGVPRGFCMHGTRLNVPLFLQRTEQFFRKHHHYVNADIDPGADVVISDQHIEVPRLKLTADRMIFCQGATGQDNPWFPGQPDQPLRGEILTVQLSRQLDFDVCLGNYWLTPVHSLEGPDSGESAAHDYLLGATYDRVHLTAGATTAGRDELLSALPELVDGPWTVVNHVSGIRAGTRRREVIAQFHPEFRNVGILNGLGSYGSLLAPMAVQQLLSEPLVTSRMVSHSSGNGARGRGTLTSKAHTIVRRAVMDGDLLLDATAGNGHDTLFLAGLTDGSRVTAIDIQPTALEKTRERLMTEGRSNVCLILGDHADEIENILRQQSDQAGVFGAVMFNLGYLPGGDKLRTTRTESTLRAITAAERLLRPGGVMTVLAYRGHPGGPEEALAVRQLADRFSECLTDVIESDRGDATAPVLIVFRKLATNAGKAVKTTSQQ